MTILGTMRRLDDTHGVVRVEDVYDTEIEDLWHACTTPERLARWIGEVTGDLRSGGAIQCSWTSGWSGSARIDACDPPRHLRLTSDPGTDRETQVEAWLTAQGRQSRLVVEERGLPVSELPGHGAGWQAHLEDLGRSLEGRSSAWRDRWAELTPLYQQRGLDR